MSAEYTITRRCGNIYTGYLFPGEQVLVQSVIVNTSTRRKRAQVWSAHTLTVDVPVGSVAGLDAAIKAGQVPVWHWTPGSCELKQVTPTEYNTTRSNP